MLWNFDQAHLGDSILLKFTFYFVSSLIGTVKVSLLRNFSLVKTSSCFENPSSQFLFLYFILHLGLLFLDLRLWDGFWLFSVLPYHSEYKALDAKARELV